jgi:predicted N-acetyltransferase YhbS
VATIDLLADQIPACEIVATWLWEQWFRGQGCSREWVREMVESRRQRDHLPLALVALAGAQPIGTASLTEEYAPAGPKRICCLAGVYVLPEFRRRGVGTRLCERAVREAKRLGHDQLYLYTAGQEAFYAQRGWRKVADVAVDTSAAFELQAFMERTGTVSGQ